MRIASIGIAAVCVVALPGCSNPPNPLLTGIEQRTTALESHLHDVTGELYHPPLRSIMADMDRSYVELWFAIESENWPLASLAAENLDEESQALARYHPASSQVPEPMIDAIAVTVQPALKEVNAALFAQDRHSARAAYASVMAACNRCHAMSGKPFLRVVEPAARPSTGLAFAPAG